jgi:hypothetical protein
VGSDAGGGEDDARDGGDIGVRDHDPVIVLEFGEGHLAVEAEGAVVVTIGAVSPVVARRPSPRR